MYRSSRRPTGLVSTALGVVTIALLNSCSDRTPPPVENQLVRPAKVTTIEATAAVKPLQLVGRVHGLQTVELSFRVGGPLQQLSALEGTQIQKGDLIAALEPTDFQLAVREASAQFKLASQDLERKRRVLADNGIAKSAVDDAETIQQLRQVQLEKAKKALKDSRITAPFDAYVAKRYVDNFTNIGPRDPIVRLHDLSQLVIQTSIPESLLATVSPERVLKLNAAFDFIPGKTFPLAYRENQGDAENMAQTYEVSFTMDNVEGLNILPGMTARVSLELSQNTDGAAIALLPTTAIVSNANNDLAVWLVDKQTQQVTRRRIETGTPEGNLIPVTSGIQIGDTIVTAGASQLAEGMTIKPITAVTR